MQNRHVLIAVACHTFYSALIGINSLTKIIQKGIVTLNEIKKKSSIDDTVTYVLRGTYNLRLNTLKEFKLHVIPYYLHSPA